MLILSIITFVGQYLSAAARATTARFVAAGTVATVAAPAAAAATSGHRMQFLVRGVTYEKYFTCKTQRLAGKRVIEVHGNLVFAYLGDDAGDAETLGSHHGHSRSGENTLTVKLPVNQEDIFVEGDHLVGVLRAEALVGRHMYIEGIVYSETFEGFLERLDNATRHSKYKFFGICGVNLMHKRLGSVVTDGIKVIADFNELAGRYFLLAFLCHVLCRYII